MNTRRAVPAVLILLGVVPVAAGAVRLGGLATGAAEDRFARDPAAVVLHVLASAVFALLGALQFTNRPSWHRKAGRVLVPAGLVSAISGLWMTATWDLPPGDGPLLTAQRLVFGGAMLVSLVLGVYALRRRDFEAHGEWMIRAYAIGMGAGTQVITHAPWLLLFGAPGEMPRAFLMLAGWSINLAVAEWVIELRKRPGLRAQSRQQLWR